MITQLTGQDLPQWIAHARDTGLPGIFSFARGLEQDLDAVTSGLTLPWSSGPVEGRVNHIRMIKRQMFGRAACPSSASASCSPPRTNRRCDLHEIGPDPANRIRSARCHAERISQTNETRHYHLCGYCQPSG